jgi:hypothetical protein
MQQYDVIIISETWLDSCITDVSLGLNNYSVYRHDRSVKTSDKSRGGGVLIAVKRTFKTKQLKIYQDNIEILLVLLKLGSGKRLVLGCSYIPPSSDINIYSQHCEEIERAMTTHEGASLLFAGDFNLPEIEWRHDMFSSGVRFSSRSRVVFDLCASLCIKQMNFIPNFNNVILDLVFTNLEGCRIVKSVDPIFRVDPHHPPLDLEIFMGNFKAGSGVGDAKAEFRDFKKADYFKICESLGLIDWSAEFRDLDIDMSLERFYHLLDAIVREHVPLRRPFVSSYPVWVTKELKELIVKKKVSHAKYKSTLSPADYACFSELRRECKLLSNGLYGQHMQNIESSLACGLNSKTFWRHVRSLNPSSKGQSGDFSLPDEMNFGDRVACSNTDKAALLADFFKSVYTLPGVPSSIGNNGSPYEGHVHNFTVSRAVVQRFLDELDVSKGAGPDGVPSLLIRSCSACLSEPLTFLFECSLRSGTFPDLWKASYLTPIFKKGDRSNVENYRPICVQSAFAKLFEKVVLYYLNPYIAPLISPRQHGFVAGKSTLSNLLLYSDYISDALTKGLQVDCVYTDFSKAFDTVDHEVLLRKIELVGIGDSLLSWFRSYLSLRKLRVRIDGVCSESFVPTSGVPQGSHLGPVLFVLFINNIAENFSDVQYLLYADDLKLFRVVENEMDCQILQDNIDLLQSWCVENSLKLNSSKCNIISFSRKRNRITVDYCLNGDPLSRVSEINDLGVIFDEKNTFVPHVHNVIDKANRMLGIVKRVCADFQNVSTMKTLFISMVRSQLEYVSPVWSPYYKNHSDAVEVIQNRFLRYINYRLGLSWEDLDYDRLRSQLGLCRLSDRREVTDVIVLKRIVVGGISCPELLELIGFHLPNRPTRQCVLFSLSNATANYSQFSSIRRLHMVGNKFNDLFDIFFDSDQTIKSKLFQHFLSGIKHP